jgi:hypothetical protein
MRKTQLSLSKFSNMSVPEKYYPGQDKQECHGLLAHGGAIIAND